VPDLRCAQVDGDCAHTKSVGTCAIPPPVRPFLIFSYVSRRVSAVAKVASVHDAHVLVDACDYGRKVRELEAQTQDFMRVLVPLVPFELAACACSGVLFV